MKHLENGVEFIDLYGAYIDESVIIGEGTVIGPCVTLSGETSIGKGCIIGQNTRIVDSRIGDNVEITCKASCINSVIPLLLGYRIANLCLFFINELGNVDNGCSNVRI